MVGQMKQYTEIHQTGSFFTVIESKFFRVISFLSWYQKILHTGDKESFDRCG